MKVLGGVMTATVIFSPFGIPLMLDKHEMYYYSILYDVKTGRNYIIKAEDFAKQDSEMLLNAHIYDTLLQIKTKKEGGKEVKSTHHKKKKAVQDEDETRGHSRGG